MNNPAAINTVKLKIKRLRILTLLKEIAYIILIRLLLLVAFNIARAMVIWSIPVLC